MLAIDNTPLMGWLLTNSDELGRDAAVDFLQLCADADASDCGGGVPRGPGQVPVGQVQVLAAADASGLLRATPTLLVAPTRIHRERRLVLGAAVEAQQVREDPRAGQVGLRQPGDGVEASQDPGEEECGVPAHQTLIRLVTTEAAWYYPTGLFKLTSVTNL